MKKILFNHFAACLATSAFLAIAPTALAQSAENSTCTQDAQGLMCKSQLSDSSTWVNAPKSELIEATANLSSNEATIPSNQLAAVSNFLLGLTYFILPAGLGLAVFLHDKHEDEIAALLNKQIELLERIWNQNPQH